MVGGLSGFALSHSDVRVCASCCVVRTCLHLSALLSPYSPAMVFLYILRAPAPSASLGASMYTQPYGTRLTKATGACSPQLYNSHARICCPSLHVCRSVAIQCCSKVPSLCSETERCCCAGQNMLRSERWSCERTQATNPTTRCRSVFEMGWMGHCMATVQHAWLAIALLAAVDSDSGAGVWVNCHSAQCAPS